MAHAPLTLPPQVMTIVPFTTDEEVIALANDCPFGLGSNVFSGNQARARAIAARLEAGMSSINDFATTYMCQGLPFGGVKESGFGRFAGERRGSKAAACRATTYGHAMVP